MARTTALDVQDIIDFDPSIENLAPFIAAASELVTEICAPEGYSEERLKIIETWLAAHFVAIRDPRYTSENFGGSSAGFHGQSGLNLDHTPYGQQAKMLDTAGGLAYLSDNVGKYVTKAQIGVYNLGSCPRNRYARYSGRSWGYQCLPPG